MQTIINSGCGFRKKPMSNQNVKQIAIQVTLEGKGVVQFDQAEQQWAYKDSEGALGLGQLGNDNVKFSKANYYTNPNYNPDDPKSKKYLRRIKISGAGLRHAIHEAVMPFHTPHFFQNPAIRCEILTSMDYLLRGWMYAPTTALADTETVRRASAYMISDAEETGNATPYIEVHSTSGERTNTSLHYGESAGDTKFVSIGSINLDQLQFLSASPNADRKAVTAEDLLAITPILNSKYGEGCFKEGYFHLNGATRPLAEKGLLFSDEFVQSMTQYLLDLISKVYIHRQSSYAKTTSIKIKFICDPTEDFIEDSYGWVEVFNSHEKKSQMNIEFTPFHFYSETSLDEIERHNKIAAEIEGKKAKSKKDKE